MKTKKQVRELKHQTFATQITVIEAFINKSSDDPRVICRDAVGDLRLIDAERFIFDNHLLLEHNGIYSALELLKLFKEDGFIHLNRFSKSQFQSPLGIDTFLHQIGLTTSSQTESIGAIQLALDSFCRDQVTELEKLLGINSDDNSKNISVTDRQKWTIDVYILQKLPQISLALHQAYNNVLNQLTQLCGDFEPSELVKKHLLMLADLEKALDFSSPDEQLSDLIWSTIMSTEINSFTIEKPLRGQYNLISVNGEVLRDPYSGVRLQINAHAEQSLFPLVNLQVKRAWKLNGQEIDEQAYQLLKQAGSQLRYQPFFNCVYAYIDQNQVVPHLELDLHDKDIILRLLLQCTVEQLLINEVDEVRIMIPYSAVRMAVACGFRLLNGIENFNQLEIVNEVQSCLQANTALHSELNGDELTFVFNKADLELESVMIDADKKCSWLDLIRKQSCLNNRATFPALGGIETKSFFSLREAALLKICKTNPQDEIQFRKVLQTCPDLEDDLVISHYGTLN